MRGDCEAETFEEAYAKNKHRLEHERNEAASLRVAMLKDGEDPGNVDPIFWEGCLEANEACWKIWTAGGKPQVISAAMRAVPAPESKPKAFLTGHHSFLESWAEAVEKNDPQTIVYW